MFLVMLLLVVIGIVLGWYIGMFSFAKEEAGAIIGGIIGLIAGVILIPIISGWVDKNAEVEVIEKRIEVAGCIIDQVQTSIIASEAYIIYTDNKGDTYEIPCDSVKIVDSDECCYVKRKYRAKGFFMNLLYDKPDEAVFYAPMEKLYSREER